MRGPHDHARERLEELLLARALHGLDAAESAELERLAREHGLDLDADEHERAAAATLLASIAGEIEAAPVRLELRLRLDAERHFAQLGRAAAPSAAPRPTPRRARAERARAAQGDSRPGAPRLGWWLAAAATLLAAFLALRDPRQRALPPSELRLALLQRAPDALRFDWSGTEDPAGAGASGDVVWSNALQEGYLRIRGLRPNRPSEEQYQLWIFDARRPAETPVDGGVFDLPPDSDEVVIPIAAKLRVFEPTLFAVTVEAPGGVVVSKRERIVMAGAAR